ncbi:class I SAM-dependent methyltransferase [Actinomadura kijaniata]|uniref:SAM-dependent methyltransferase n=1 Tax=Actinomadura namibiensis TaxID=182080 RepID=A0A7W3LTJ0_ACTNM|nr:class I SAM-dependent methyltransferase [Actinomadura namibiensis]MBA8954009.1 SAM-dependent methyltransferase [Actinomadura namibiensis]
MSARDSYDEVADVYAERMLDELAGKPLDRALLDLLADRVGALGPIADLGCGPGQVARHLHERGTATLGVDLSPRMVEIAAAAHPGIGFHVGDMRALHVPDRAWGGIAAFYSIIHLSPAEVPAAFAEFHRVLRPSGSLLLGFHLGDEVRHLDRWWDRPVNLDFQFYPRAELETALEDAGFTLDAYVERPPYPGEAETTRAYLLAHR